MTACFRVYARGVVVASWFAFLSFATACSQIPAGRSAIDSVRVLHAKDVSPTDTEGKLGTQATSRFFGLFQGVAYDYEVYDESVLQRDMTRVVRFYRSKGFFDAQARVGRVFRAGESHVRVEIVVDEGQPTRNHKVTVTGTDGLPRDVVEAVVAAANAALPPGDRFDEEKFAASEAAVKRALTDRGYAYATADGQAQLDLGAHEIDYAFSVVPGPRAVFGAITIVGLDPDTNGPRRQEIPEAPLRRAIHIWPGSTYSTAEIDAATQALLNLDVFSSVQIVPALSNPPPADNVVPLTVKVSPQRLRQITLGAGVELDEIKTEVHGIVSWEDRNFLGGLRDFTVSLKPGVVLYPFRIGNFHGPIQPLPEGWFSTELRQPAFPEARTSSFIRPQFNVFPLLVETNPPPGAPVIGYREAKVVVGVERTFFKKLHVSFDYTFQFEDPFPYVPPEDPSLQRLIISYPELIAQLDLRDDARRPHAGVYLANSLQVAGLGGDAHDLRVQPELRTYLPIARGVTFATRGSVGFLLFANYAQAGQRDGWNQELTDSATTAALPNTDAARSRLARDTQIMFFRGFFSGGPTTNRGYPVLGVSPYGVVPYLTPSGTTQQVQNNCNPNAPPKPDGTPVYQPAQCFVPVGGFSLWELQNDVRFDVSGPLSASVFCDMGDVSPQPGVLRFKGHEAQGDVLYLHLSCGVGAAYDTPVGPIRADVGVRVLEIAGDAGSSPVDGHVPTILGAPIGVAIGIGQAF